MNWTFVLKSCLTTTLIIAGFTAAGWWGGSKAFEEHVRKIRIRNQKEFFTDIQMGVTSDFRRPPTEDEILTKERREGKGASRAFSMVYAYYAFWGAVALTGGHALLRLALLQLSARPKDIMKKDEEESASGTASDSQPSDLSSSEKPAEQVSPGESTTCKSIAELAAAFDTEVIDCSPVAEPEHQK